MTMLSATFAEFWKNQWQEAFGGIGHAVGDALEPESLSLFGLEVSPTLFISIIISLSLILIAAVLRAFVIPKFKKQPKGMQLFLESLVGYFDQTAGESTHNHAGFVGPFIFVAAVFIAVGTLLELFGVRPPLSSINTCFALGLSAFCVIQICGARQKRLKRLKRYLNPIYLVTDLAVPLSLSLRLFGAILSGFIIMEILYSIAYTAWVLPAAVSLITTILHAFLQAYLFATLTGIYVGEAIE